MITTQYDETIDMTMTKKSLILSLCIVCASVLIAFAALFQHYVSSSLSATRPAPVKVSDSQLLRNSTTEEESPEPLVGHIIPHSHCDAAYKKTVDEYYETQVRHVLNSILDALQDDDHRRFLWSETVFLMLWWKDPRTTWKDKHRLHRLIQSGKVELVNGGWVMHDEAITRYDSQIHQMTLGHDILQQIFVNDKKFPDVHITTGWQIDPFGASSMTVNLYNWSGMDILILNRFPPYIKDQLKANQSLEFFWHVGGANILVHVMDEHYESPSGFDWEGLPNPSPPVTDDNLPQKSDEFMAVVRKRSVHYRTKNVFIPMGGDFRFQNASWQFENMDRIVQYVQNNSERYQGDTLRYSTVREYKQAVTNSMDAMNETFPVLVGSHFLPLWGGYYTQNPMLKQMVRCCETLMRACQMRLFQALRQDQDWQIISKLMQRLHFARETVGMMQHHDAVTATSYRFVLVDYMKRLRFSYHDMTDVLLRLIYGFDDSDQRLNSSPTSTWNKGNIIGGGSYLYENILIRDTQSAKTIHMDQILNPQMGMKGISLIVINSLWREVDTLVHFVCTRPDVSIVLQSEGENSQTDNKTLVLAQATPLEQELESADLGLFLISFRAKVAPLGKTWYKVFVCDLTKDTNQHPPPKIPSLNCAVEAHSLSKDDFLRQGLKSQASHLLFHEDTHDTANFTVFFPEGHFFTTELNHDVVLYNGKNDTVYEFKTNVEWSNPPTLLGAKQRWFVCAYSGPLFSEVTLELTPWLIIRYRVLNTTESSRDLDSLLHVSMLSGPIPPVVNVASRFQTSLANASWFYDENSFHPVQAAYNNSLGVGDGNVRPLVSRSWFVSDKEPCSTKLTVFSTDPRGVVSHSNGQFDVFWQRRNNSTQAWWNTNNRDWWKEGEDLSTVRSSIWLSLDRCYEPSSNDVMERRISSLLANDLIMVQSGTDQVPLQDNPFCGSVPSYSHIVSLRPAAVDKSLNVSREEAWVDVQIENFSDSEELVIDLRILLGNISRAILDASNLYSMTFLNKKGLSKEFGQDHTMPCDYFPTNGGLHWLLTVHKRGICSVRVPLEPLTNSEPIYDSELS